MILALGCFNLIMREVPGSIPGQPRILSHFCMLVDISICSVFFLWILDCIYKSIHYIACCVNRHCLHYAFQMFGNSKQLPIGVVIDRH
ncbi:hypothetical protein BT67DRAFT_288942 [Trichocladium antarcticum]|uniref:Uncharacterized protein n=1 Tax=Trichocladium antarcticum TaxID=1450529 RepID=A0AAN6ULW2_9PEZI|nr:hypothetical protein BT67DRAFT_288942 [Trichocladium antarcticum]